MRQVHSLINKNKRFVLFLCKRYVLFLSSDLRNLSNAAKTVSELEKLLTNPPLVEIKLVADCASQVKAFGKNIRLLAQDRLLASIQEKNQASIANSLQVFYNLESLPEIILLVVDSTVKRTVDGSKAALDIEAVHSLLSQAQQGDTGAGALGAGAAAASAMAPMSATKKPAGAAAATGGAGAGAFLFLILAVNPHFTYVLQLHAITRF